MKPINRMPTPKKQEALDKIKLLAAHGFTLDTGALDNARARYLMSSRTRVQVGITQPALRLKDTMSTALSKEEMKLIAKYFIIMYGNELKIKLEE